MPLIELRDISFSYCGEPVLSHLDLSIEEGSFVAVLGANGSGKSTLARMLNAIVRPSEGRILIDGSEPVDVYSVRRLIGLVMQDPDSQLVADTVEDDVAFGPENMGLESVEIERRVRQSLSLCGIEDLAEISPSRLSGGQKQLVAIAGVLAMEGRCIVLDEATSMLDPEGREAVLSAVKMLNGKGLTIVLMTHDPEEAQLASKVLVLGGGRVAICGSPDSVFSKEEELGRLGIDVPMVYKLKNALKRNGIALPQDIVDLEGLVNELKARRSGC